MCPGSGEGFGCGCGALNIVCDDDAGHVLIICSV